MISSQAKKDLRVQDVHDARLQHLAFEKKKTHKSSLTTHCELTASNAVMEAIEVQLEDAH